MGYCTHAIILLSDCGVVVFAGGVVLEPCALLTGVAEEVEAAAGEVPFGDDDETTLITSADFWRCKDRAPGGCKSSLTTCLPGCGVEGRSLPGGGVEGRRLIMISRADAAFLTTTGASNASTSALLCEPRRLRMQGRCKAGRRVSGLGMGAENGNAQQWRRGGADSRGDRERSPEFCAFSLYYARAAEPMKTA